MEPIPPTVRQLRKGQNSEAVTPTLDTQCRSQNALVQARIHVSTLLGGPSNSQWIRLVNVLLLAIVSLISLIAAASFVWYACIPSGTGSAIVVRQGWVHIYPCSSGQRLSVGLCRRGLGVRDLCSHFLNPLAVRYGPKLEIVEAASSSELGRDHCWLSCSMSVLLTLAAILPLLTTMKAYQGRRARGRTLTATKGRW